VDNRSHKFNQDGSDPLLNLLLTCPEDFDNVQYARVYVRKSNWVKNYPSLSARTAESQIVAGEVFSDGI
jgi:hypothetical protein